MTLDLDAIQQRAADAGSWRTSQVTKGDLAADVLALVARVRELEADLATMEHRYLVAHSDGERARSSLRTLRDAWNAHFETCPTSVPEIPSPTLADIERWANAPSDTA